MFLSHYNLREQPFGVTPDPRYLYQSQVHREALASLVYGIESELGFTALIAEPGMGKTTLLYYLLTKYRAVASTAFLFETQCSSRELLQHLFAELEIPMANPQDMVAMRNRFKEFLVTAARARRRVLVIVDEAQNLDKHALETVRLLSNFETAQSKLLHIILAGQPQLAEKLSRPELAQLRQRIAMVTRLTSFSPEETREYIEHRLAVAGYQGGPLFSPEALASIASYTRGVPREINRMCFGALSLGCALYKKQIDAAVVREVAEDLDISPILRRNAPRPAPATRATAASAPEIPLAVAGADPANRVLNDAAPTETPLTPVFQTEPAAVEARAAVNLHPAEAAAARAPEPGEHARVVVITAKSDSAAKPESSVNAESAGRSPTTGKAETARSAAPLAAACAAPQPAMAVNQSSPPSAAPVPTISQAVGYTGPRREMVATRKHMPAGQSGSRTTADQGDSYLPLATTAGLVAPPAARSSRHRVSFAEVAGLGVFVPLLLWLMAYLAVRFGWTPWH